MTLIPTVVLPGLDGTGLLLEDFASCNTERFETTIVRFPIDTWKDYGQLVSLVLDQLPDAPALLIAESFSGPIAIRVATAEPSRVAGLVLAATFITPPVSRMVTYVPLATLFRLPVPRWTIRSYMVGDDASGDLVELVRTAIRSVHPRLLAGRVRMICHLDVRKECHQCRCPILYVRAARDSMVPEKCGAEIAALNPQVSLVTVDAPHFVLQRRPREVWGHIQTFTDGTIGI